MKVSGFSREKWSFLKHVLTTKKSLFEICNSRKILTNEDQSIVLPRVILRIRQFPDLLDTMDNLKHGETLFWFHCAKKLTRDQ